MSVSLVPFYKVWDSSIHLTFLVRIFFPEEVAHVTPLSVGREHSHGEMWWRLASSLAGLPTLWSSIVSLQRPSICWVEFVFLVVQCAHFQHAEFEVIFFFGLDFSILIPGHLKPRSSHRPYPGTAPQHQYSALPGFLITCIHNEILIPQFNSGYYLLYLAVCTI